MSSFDFQQLLHIRTDYLVLPPNPYHQAGEWGIVPWQFFERQPQGKEALHLW